MEIYENYVSEYHRLKDPRQLLDPTTFFLSLYKDTLQENYNNFFRSHPLNSLDFIIPHINNIAYPSKPQKDNREILFITINPSSEVVFEDFYKKFELIKKRPFMVNLAYTYEQRGKTEAEMGTGFHIHFMIDKTKYVTPAQVQRNLYSSFKSMVGSMNSIDVRKYPFSYREEKLMYMTGQKWEAEKEASCKVNEIWRQKNNLMRLYQ